METLNAGAEKLGLRLSRSQLAQFETYYRELIDWNKRINLTAITGYEDVQVKHFLDSLTIILALKPSAGGKRLSVIDVGAGAGLPGIPLKIILPELKLTLLEATAKKAVFLEHLKVRLGMNDIEIVVGRAEEVAHQDKYREKFNIVLSRAVAPLPALVELTLPFCAAGGSFIAQKKGDIESEVKQADRAIGLMGGELKEVKRIDLPEFSDERWLVIIDKVLPTHQKYPRRPGIPARKPIV